MFRELIIILWLSYKVHQVTKIFFSFLYDWRRWNVKFLNFLTKNEILFLFIRILFKFFLFLENLVTLFRLFTVSRIELFLFHSRKLYWAGASIPDPKLPRANCQQLPRQIRRPPIRHEFSCLNSQCEDR